MADFALWAAACETAFWGAAIESIIEADPLATCVRTIMGERSSWSGSASDLLRLCAESDREDATMRPPWAECDLDVQHAQKRLRASQPTCEYPRVFRPARGDRGRAQSD